MTRDTVQQNISVYEGDVARAAWSVDTGLYEGEKIVLERHFPPPPARILDLGCGAGRTTAALEAMGYDVVAIDLSADLVDEARRRVQHTRVEQMDARYLDFLDAEFDAVLFSFNGLDCVHPEVERQRVLAEVRRVLRPGGVFYYSGHNGVATFLPRPGDSLLKTLRRDRALLAAQRRPFTERSRYLAHPSGDGVEILYAALPPRHAHGLQQAGLELVAVYGSRSYRKGPHFVDEIAADEGIAKRALRNLRLALMCPHLHYVARRPER